MPRKKALLVGINEYSLSKYNLRGCVADVESLKRLLVQKVGFDDNDIATLLDQEATSVAIKAGLGQLLTGVQTGDVRVFAFSGHGTQKGIDSGNEFDGKDEALVPHDVTYTGLITDDELNRIISPAIPDDGSVSFTAIYDCCHSGTYNREVDLFLYLNAFATQESEILNRCINLPVPGEVRDVLLGPYTILSACKDEETAADLKTVPDEGTPRGAFSYALHQVLRDNPRPRVRDLEDSVLTKVKAVSSHGQTPQYFSLAPDSQLFTPQ